MAAELLAEEGPPAGLLAGRFVELHGADWAVDAYDCALSPIGELVEPEGKRGVARWDSTAEEYYVETIDGLVVPARDCQLREVERTGAEAGGYDLVWPTVSMERAGPTFALRVAEKLRERGFCILAMPPDPRRQTDAKGMASARTDWSLPHEELEELFLGRDHSCKVAWLAGAEPPHDQSTEPLGTYSRRLEDLSASLLPWTEGMLGFKASDQLAFPLLRAASGGAPVPSPGPVAEGEASDGHVEKVLDFVQRRKLCMMYFVTSGGGLELWPLSPPGSSSPASPALATVAHADRLLIFRHDLFSCRTIGNGLALSMALQAWLLEEPMLLEIESLQGSQGRLEQILAGPKLPPEKQVHIMNCHCRYPANGLGLTKDWLVYSAQTDCFVEIPVGRFDVLAYYDDGSGGQFNAAGKTSTKHCGLLADLEWIEFDNQCFGIEGRCAAVIPPMQRVYLEVSYEMLTLVGFTQQTLRGAKIYFCIADIGMEFDQWAGYHTDPAAWLSAGMNTNLSVNRLMHTFGVAGPCHQVDTACSASLVASNMCHAYLRKRSKEANMSLSLGGQNILQPWPFIGLSAAGMLGGGGRCKTFDQSANGYNRGEGVGGVFCKASDDIEATMERLACYVSSYINQDGRSASLTAPNGPSQQMVVRGSLGQGEISPDWVACTENHGTGTALGDPIETGTIRSVFRKRDALLPVTSGKSHMGHLECGAGCVGILKTIASIVHGGVPPNCHLRMPNAHCDTEGFPGMFPVELCDIGTEVHYGGCNGFGFGGTNTRADFWAVRRNNVHFYENARRELVLTKSRPSGEEHTGIMPLMPRIDKLDFVTVPCAHCLGPMCWLCGLVPPEAAPPGRHRCVDVREEGASYLYCSRCYEGGYLCGGGEASQLNRGMAVGQRLQLLGSWNAWAAPTDLQPVAGSADGDAWEADVALGDTLQEQFCVVVQRGRSRHFIHPAAKQAGQRVRPVGPVEEMPPDQYWLVDGYRDGAVEGTVYRVRFEWSDYRMDVSWRPARDPVTALPLTVPRTFQHQYFVVNSLTGWAPVVGTHDPDDPYQWLWFNGSLPDSGKVEMLFLRDNDQSQMIYPLSSTPEEDSVPVVGPDAGGHGKRWLAWGKKGEKLRCYLRVQDGETQVSVETASMGRKTWRGSARSSYHLAGSWNNWQPIAMSQEAGFPDVWRASFIAGDDGCEEFQFLVNQNWNLRLHPASAGSKPGESAACGPGRRGKGKNWKVYAVPGTIMEVTLDLGAEDYCNVVKCTPLIDKFEVGFM